MFAKESDTNNKKNESLEMERRRRRRRTFADDDDRMYVVIACAFALQSVRACLDVAVPVTASEAFGFVPSDLALFLGARWYGLFVAMIVIAKGTRSSVPMSLCAIAACTWCLRVAQSARWYILAHAALAGCGALVGITAVCANVLVQMLESPRWPKSRLNTWYRVCGGITYGACSLVSGGLDVREASTRFDAWMRSYAVVSCALVATAIYVRQSSHHLRCDVTKTRESDRHTRFHAICRPRTRSMLIFAVLVAVLASCAAVSRAMIEPRFVRLLRVSDVAYSRIHATSSVLSLVGTVVIGHVLTSRWTDAKVVLVMLSCVMSLSMLVVARYDDIPLASAAIIATRVAEESAKVPCSVWLADLAFTSVVPASRSNAPTPDDRRAMAAVLASCIAIQKLVGACLKAVMSWTAAYIAQNVATESVYVASATAAAIAASLLCLVPKPRKAIFSH